MPAYATQNQVLAEFKDFVPTSSSAISTTDIDGYLAQADAEINAMLGVKYVTPITGTQALILVAMIETWLVKDRIEQVLAVKTGRPSDSQEGSRSLRKQALDLIKQLCDGTVILPDAPLAGSGDGIDSYTNQNDTPHIFDRDTTQW